jgi:hypothetical protein
MSTEAHLHIAENLSLPLDAVTQTFAILAKRGVGKTYTASVMTEEMLKASLQVVVIDPVGVWWGLRAGADKKSEGLEIIVMGGPHADVPLEPTAGEVTADFVVDSGRSVLLDLSGFRKGDMIRFMTAFAETLYRKNRAPLHLMVDEADAFAPQKTMHGEGAERLLGAMEDIVRRGRARGLGVTLVTQRAAVLNKNVLTQIEVLVALRTIAPQDREAIDAWIHVHGTPKQREKLMESLPSLPIGTAWFWSPGWLDLFRQVKVRKRETFDSSATPKVGQKLDAPKKLKPVDLEALREKMAATIEQAKANDPRELREQIGELQRQVKILEDTKPAPKVETKRVEVPVLKDAQLKRAEKILDRLDDAICKVIGVETVLTKDVFQPLRDALSKLQPNAANPARHSYGAESLTNSTGASRSQISKLGLLGNMPRKIESTDRATPGPKAGASLSPDADITNPQQRILDALASLEASGLRDVDKSNAAVFADQSPTSSGYTNNLGRLRSLGLIHYPQQGRVGLTDQGRTSAQNDGSILTRADLHRAWFSKLAAPKVRILENLIRAYPEPMEKVALAEASQQSPTSSGYTNNLGNLRSLGLIDYPQQGYVVATELLFPPSLPE